MESAQSVKHGRVESWFGLGLGLLFVVVAVVAWIQSGDRTHLLGAAGFACWAVVWSKSPLSFTTSLREQFTKGPKLSRTDTVLSGIGFALVAIALALRWLL